MIQSDSILGLRSLLSDTIGQHVGALGTYQLISRGGGGAMVFLRGEICFPPDRGRAFFHQTGGRFFSMNSGDNCFQQNKVIADQ